VLAAAVVAVGLGPYCTHYYCTDIPQLLQPGPVVAVVVVLALGALDMPRTHWREREQQQEKKIAFPEGVVPLRIDLDYKPDFAPLTSQTVADTAVEVAGTAGVVAPVVPAGNVRQR